MTTLSKEIEAAIDEILNLNSEKTEKRVPGKPGRKRNPPTQIWSLSFHDPQHNITYALISTCIKEDYSQSLEQLAMRLSIWKSRPINECMCKLRSLKRSGKLGYYDENCVFRTWDGEEKGYGLESMCG